MKYDETGEEIVQVKILDDTNKQQGDAKMMTFTQLDELEESLPEGWKAEWI